MNIGNSPGPVHCHHFWVLLLFRSVKKIKKHAMKECRCQLKIINRKWFRYLSFLDCMLEFVFNNTHSKNWQTLAFHHVCSWKKFRLHKEEKYSIYELSINILLLLWTCTVPLQGNGQLSLLPYFILLHFWASPLRRSSARLAVSFWTCRVFVSLRLRFTAW